MNRTLTCIGLPMILGLTAGPLLPQERGYGDLDPADSAEVLVEKAPTADESGVRDIGPLEDERGAREYRMTFRTRTRVRLEEARGYLDGTFLGSSLESYSRAEIRAGGRFRGGVLAAKDPGEARIDDFTGGYVMMDSAGLLARAIVGDYVVEEGQGIALWRSLDFSKGGDVLRPVNRSARGILPHTSPGEGAYLRGLAGELRIATFSASLFFSRRLLAGTLDEAGFVRSISTSGLFRTKAEEASRDAVREELYGVHGAFGQGKTLSGGFTFYTSEFSRPLRLSSGAGFTGLEYFLVSLDYTLALPEIALSGEWSVLTGEASGISTILLNPSPALRLAAAYRHYPRRSYGLHGLGFGEQSETSNEEGMYAGLRLTLSRDVQISSYHDAFRFPQAEGGQTFSSGGQESLLRLAIHPCDFLHLYLQYQRKTSGRSGQSVNPDGLAHAVTGDQVSQRYRLQLVFGHSKSLTIRGRIEKLMIDRGLGEPRQEGVLVYQEIGSAEAGPVSAKVRLVFFRTGSYDARMSEAEEDLPGAASTPIVYGDGERWYALIRIGPWAGLECSAKYSCVIRDDVVHIGSGPDRLPGNSDDRVSFQFDLRI